MHIIYDASIVPVPMHSDSAAAERVIYLGTLAELNGGAGRNGAGAAGTDRHDGDILRLVRANNMLCVMLMFSMWSSFREREDSQRLSLPDSIA